MPLWRNGATDQSRKGEAGLPGTFSLSWLEGNLPLFWSRDSGSSGQGTALTVLGVVHSCVSLLLQEALRHDRSNLLQKELHNKEQELEKILYRQKKVMGSKSFLTKHIPFCCLSVQAFSDGKWCSDAEDLALDNLALASEVSCLWRCWDGLSWAVMLFCFVHAFCYLLGVLLAQSSYQFYNAGKEDGVKIWKLWVWSFFWCIRRMCMDIRARFL